MTLVIDANVAVKWYVLQEDRQRAIEVRRSGGPMLAPALIIAECASAFWMHIRKGEMTIEQGKFAIEALPDNFTELVEDRRIAAAALVMAAEIKHSPLDCIYLALAEAMNTKLVTADDVFVAKLVRQRRVKNVIRLVNWQS